MDVKAKYKWLDKQPENYVLAFFLVHFYISGNSRVRLELDFRNFNCQVSIKWKIFI